MQSYRTEAKRLHARELKSPKITGSSLACRRFASVLQCRSTQETEINKLLVRSDYEGELLKSTSCRGTGQCRLVLVPGIECGKSGSDCCHTFHQRTGLDDGRLANTCRWPSTN